MTNRERINEMPDDILVAFLSLESRCPPDLESSPCPDYIPCKSCWLKWLDEETAKK